MKDNKQFDKRNGQESEGETCESCCQDFKNEINELVDNVEGYSNKDHMEKEKEVEQAFGDDRK